VRDGSQLQSARAQDSLRTIPSLVESPILAQTKTEGSATGSPISDVPTKNQMKPVRSIAKPEKPASTLPGTANVQNAIPPSPPRPMKPVAPRERLYPDIPELAASCQ
jgi:hypothetical protein